jgi:hypothetical protein
MGQILVGTDLGINPLRIGAPLNYGVVYHGYANPLLHHNYGFGGLISPYSNIAGIPLLLKK